MTLRTPSPPHSTLAPTTTTSTPTPTPTLPPSPLLPQVGGESGSADTARDPRGFAVKFYSEEGNWDLVGNNTPIFFIRDPILFPR